MESFSSPDEVAIIIPLFNPNVKLLKKLLSSISNQSYEKWRCFLYDDSLDSHSQIIAEICDARFIYIKNDEMRGIYNNYKMAITDLSKIYQYIFLTDQDDIWHRNKVKKYLEKFSEGNFGVIVGNGRVVTERGKVLEPDILNAIGEKPSLDYLLLVGNVYPGTLLAICPNNFPQGLIFPEIIDLPFKFFPHDDWLICISSYLENIGFLELKLTDYVQHQNNTIGYRPPKMTKSVMKSSSQNHFFGDIFPNGASYWWNSDRPNIYIKYNRIAKLLMLYPRESIPCGKKDVYKFIENLSFSEFTWDKQYFLRTIKSFNWTSERQVISMWRRGRVGRRFWNNIWNRVIKSKKKVFPREWKK
jgi:hypothetical protein